MHGIYIFLLVLNLDYLYFSRTALNNITDTYFFDFLRVGEQS